MNRPATTPYRAWLAGWAGAAAIAVGNGAVRQSLLSPRMSERRAHRLSSLSLASLLGVYTVVLQRARPIPTPDGARRIGCTWLALTLAFEFGLGRAQGMTWSRMLADYDLRRGRVWSLVVAWIGVLPSLSRIAVRRMDADRTSAPPS